MRRKNLTILLDADDIVYQCNQAALDAINAEKGTYYSISEIKSWGATGNRTIDERTKLFSNPEFIKNLPLYEGAKEFVEELKTLGNVYFCTAVNPECMSVRAEALIKDFNIDAKHIIMASNKSLVKADFHLDDCAENIKNSSAVHPVLFRRPWNYELSGIPTVSRYEDFITYIKFLSQPVLETPVPKNPIVCLVAPTGAGKTDFIMEAHRNGYAVPLSLTTKRTDKFNYKYIPVKDFIELKGIGAFLETTAYQWNDFGILKGDKAFDSEKVIVPIDICGAIGLKNRFPERVVFVYLNTPKQDIIANILAREGSIEEKTNLVMSLEAEMLNEELCDFSLSSFEELTKIL